MVSKLVKQDFIHMLASSTESVAPCQKGGSCYFGGLHQLHSSLMSFTFVASTHWVEATEVTHTLGRAVPGRTVPQGLELKPRSLFRDICGVVNHRVEGKLILN